MRVMSVLTWLALRELWMSFRLLAALGLLLGAGALTALLPGGDQGSVSARFAVALLVASLAVAALAAATLSNERQRGAVAWLVSRAVSRATLLSGWFAAFGGVLLVGLLPGALLAWLALAATRPALDPVVVGVTLVAAASGGLLAIAVGLLSGLLLAPLPAAAACLLVCGAAVGLGFQSAADAALLPLGGYLLLAMLPEATRPLASALGSIGIAVAATAVLLAVARIAFERVDL